MWKLSIGNPENPDNPAMKAKIKPKNNKNSYKIIKSAIKI